mmetsp:Transcript_25040/g.38851  ORF Transcript_25040/g.38851 Transcript_25040/m.38851 type:complete len:167 (+) Transcript_25040:3872-4372(+)
MSFYRQKLEEFLPNKEHVTSVADMAFESFRYDKLVTQAYLEEVEEVIQFLMIAVQNSLLTRAQEQKEFIRFLSSKSEVLHALGINITLPTKGSLNRRYDMISAQIDELPAQEKGVFAQLQQLYENEKADRKAASSECSAREQERNRERQEQTEQMRLEKERKLKEL